MTDARPVHIAETASAQAVIAPGAVVHLPASRRRPAEAALESSDQLRARHNELAHLARVIELGELAAAVAHEINEDMLKHPAQAIGKRRIDPEAAALVAGLSERQRQVLQGIFSGLQNKVIAYQLDLSIRTVEAYRAQLMDRLGARGTADAVRVAIAPGYAESPAFPQFHRRH